ncbi:MAG: hypothetical protein RIT02_1361 [Planctomycetota bacterium]
MSLQFDVADCEPDGSDGGNDDGADACADPREAACGPVDSVMSFASDLQEFSADVSEAGSGEPFIDAFSECLQGLDGFFGIECAVHAGGQCL